MSIVVYKYPITIGRTDLNLPVEAKIVHVGLDPSGAPCLWAEVDPYSDRERRTFVIIGTGHGVPEKATHIGSVVDEMYVWHVYEISHV
jgi:hypothetical protein